MSARRGTRRTVVLALVGGIALAASSAGRIAATAGADPPAGVDGPIFSDDELVLPPDFREWIYLGGGVGVTDHGGAEGRAPGLFTNVFVNPAAHTRFQTTGRWPEQTVLVLEIRGAAPQGAPNPQGHAQTGVLATEVAVKDPVRFSATGGWGYFLFSPEDTTAPALARDASCYQCHAAQAAVDHTFVQFYPTLLDSARRAGTLDPARLIRNGSGR